MHATQAAEATIDLDAIAANVGVLATVAEGAQVMAVVKADGYGHGAAHSARAALAGGAQWLGVAHLHEALTLRSAGIEAPILAWLHVPGEDFGAAIAADVDVTVSAEWALREIVAAATTDGRTASVHLKIDTGLARNGARPDTLAALVPALARAEAAGAIRLVSAWSHFACADEPGHPSLDLQEQVFADALVTLGHAGLRPELTHLANSPATLTRPQAHRDLVRVGVAAYGVSPFADPARDARHFGLRPAMTLTARLSSVKPVTAGTGISYGHTHVTARDTVLGLVPMGYGDGLPRSASGRGQVGVAGRRHTIAGRVCMDQVVVDLGPGSTAQPGDEVVVLGPDPLAGPTAADWAQAADTIGYEIVTRIGARVPRRYVGALAEQMTEERRDAARE